MVSIEGEREKLPIENLSRSSVEEPVVEEPVKPIDTVNPLGDDFKGLPEPDIEGCRKRVRQESAAVRRLRTGEGVMSNLPKERGQILKGIQQVEVDLPGVIEEAGVVEIAQLDKFAAVAVGLEMDELSYQEARRRFDWPEWQKAINVELENLNAAGTWDVVQRPENTNVVDSKWVFRLKNDAEGRIVKWKARLVARGFTPVYGVDYFETFAPVAR